MRLQKLSVSLFSAMAMAVVVAAPGPARAAEEEKADPTKEQIIPILTYRTGPFAAGGSGFASGNEDYYTLLNERDGGIGGVKLVYEECEFGYNSDRGVECYERLKKKGPTGASFVHPQSTGVTYRLIERATVDKIPVVSVGYGRTDATDGRVFPYIFPLITNYWSQNTAKIKYIGQQEGGMDKLKGKKIANLYHKSSSGGETIPVLDVQAEKYGFTVKHYPVAHPGLDQKAAWLDISRKFKPDWVILRGWGVMNPTALKEAARAGFPATKILGVWWSGAEEDVLPAGKAAIGYVAAGFHPAGNFAVTDEVLRVSDVVAIHDDQVCRHEADPALPEALLLPGVKLCQSGLACLVLLPWDGRKLPAWLHGDRPQPEREVICRPRLERRVRRWSG